MASSVKKTVPRKFSTDWLEDSIVKRAVLKDKKGNQVTMDAGDEIARGLSPFNPEASALLAGRVMIERLHALADAGESFAFETTCAGRSHGNFLRRCRAAGYSRRTG